MNQVYFCLKHQDMQTVLFFFHAILKGFPVATSPLESGFSGFPATFQKPTSLKITNVNMLEGINHFFGPDLTFTYAVEEPLWNEANKSECKKIVALYFLVIVIH